MGGGKGRGTQGKANLRVSIDTVFNNPRREEGTVDVLPVVVELGVGEVGAFAEEADYADGVGCFCGRGGGFWCGWRGHGGVKGGKEGEGGGGEGGGGWICG